MGLKPEFRLLANGGDITGTLQPRLKSLRFTDEAGMESDALEVVLDDADPDSPVQMPPTGAELELFLGYDGTTQRMGLFVVDEIELSGWPGEMRITARAAPFDKSKGGKNTLQSQKTRSWPKGTKLAAMVQKIAKEHGMEGAVSQSLASVTLPHMDQSDESDMHFLVRIARKYDAVVKPAGGKLVVAKRGESKSVSGQPLPAVALTPADVSNYRVTLSKRENSGSVVAAWHETKKAKRNTITVGSGEPVTRLRQQYTTEDMAKAAATAELDKRNRQLRKLSMTLPGRPDLAAEAPLKLSGFRDGVNGDWLVTSVEHSLDNAGYICTINAEVPNGTGQQSVTRAQD